MIMNIRLCLSSAIKKSNHDRSYYLESLVPFVNTTKPVKIYTLFLQIIDIPKKKVTWEFQMKAVTKTITKILTGCRKN